MKNNNVQSLNFQLCVPNNIQTLTVKKQIVVTKKINGKTLRKNYHIKNKKKIIRKYLY